MIKTVQKYKNNNTIECFLKITFVADLVSQHQRTLQLITSVGPPQCDSPTLVTSINVDDRPITAGGPPRSDQPSQCSPCS